MTQVRRAVLVALAVMLSPLIIVVATVGCALYLLVILPEQRQREMERYRWDD